MNHRLSRFAFLDVIAQGFLYGVIKLIERILICLLQKTVNDTLPNPLDCIVYNLLSFAILTETYQINEAFFNKVFVIFDILHHFFEHLSKFILNLNFLIQNVVIVSVVLLKVVCLFFDSFQFQVVQLESFKDLRNNLVLLNISRIKRILRLIKLINIISLRFARSINFNIDFINNA